jgi:hypothetical protein
MDFRKPMTHQPLRRRIILWLITTTISVPLGWWVTRSMGRSGSDFVWAALVCGPPWVVLRLIARDYYWNAFFFGFLPPVLAFEAPAGLGTNWRQATLMVAVAPLVAYAIFGFTNLIIFGGAGAARLAREAISPDEDAASLLRRFGRWLRASTSLALRWYAIWLGGAAAGFGLALATQARASAAGTLSSELPLALLSRAAVGLVAGGLAWALLRLPGSSAWARDNTP